jgi:predicted carbohydrate-binding protein with CBM48
MSDLDPRLEPLVARLKELPEPRPYRLAQLRTELNRSNGARTSRTTGWIVLSPARAALSVALIVLATSAVWMGISQSTRAREASGRTPVQFVFVAEQAARVSLVGDFNDWDPAATPLSRAPGGVWSAVLPLRPGRFTYSFVVDGRVWHGDPEAPVNTNDFGRPSSVVFVAQSETRS